MPKYRVHVSMAVEVEAKTIMEAHRLGLDQVNPFGALNSADLTHFDVSIHHFEIVQSNKIGEIDTPIAVPVNVLEDN